MTESALTVSILREIRDEIRATNTNLSSRIDSLETGLSTRIDETNARLDLTNVRLGVVEHTLQGVAAQLVIMGRYMKNVSVRHEGAIDETRKRVTRLEGKRRT